MNIHDLKCPKCNSDNLQKISLIIESGTHNFKANSSTTAKSSGIGIGMGGGIGVGVGKTEATSSTAGTSASQLVERLLLKYRKPELEVERSTGAMVGLLFGPLIGYMSSHLVNGIWPFAVGFVAFILVAALYPDVDKVHNEQVKKRNSEKTQRWRKWIDSGFFCHRCGHEFIPGSEEKG